MADSVYVATFNGTLMVELAPSAGWGGNSAGSGGGGASYARKAAIPCTNGQNFIVRQGQGKTIFAGSQESGFGPGAWACYAPPAGNGGAANILAAGSQAGSCVADVAFSGGNGGIGVGSVGGGGGGGATWQAVGGTGSSPGPGGLNGDGQPSGGDAVAGADGGFGFLGGGAAAGSPPGSGQYGDDGWVRVFDDRVNGGAWPPLPGTPVLLTVGSAPPVPVPPFNPKAQKTAFIG